MDQEMRKILLITDNDLLLNRFKELILRKNLSDFIFHFAYSENNTAFQKKFNNVNWIRSIKIKNEVDFLINEYEIIFSLHCKQMFPEDLIKKVKCINIHPGLNPNNRGWFPQVFSIINGLPCGATIHEIDELLDHGPIICQKQVNVELWDTSITVYNRVLDAEMELLSDNFEKILLNKYETYLPKEGNLNLKKDFDDLCKINLNETDTFLNHLNKLRALTHGSYANAYFIDKKSEKRIYIKIEMNHE